MWHGIDINTKYKLGLLIIILGPTGVGKSDMAMQMAIEQGCSIISADSRQIYREIPIGTAAPTHEMLQRVHHFFVGTRSITEHYSAGQYEIDAIPIVEQEIAAHGNAVMAGGSMMYIDAIAKGIDAIPDIDEEIRKSVREMYEREGIEAMRMRLKLLDPEYYAEVDLMNWKRIVHAIEVCEQTGGTFTQLRTGATHQRAFGIRKIGIRRQREDLYARIDRRVEEMMDLGLEKEARKVYPMRELNALNTVGYKELFGHFDGAYDIREAVRLIQRNSRHYARKQMTWFQRDSEIEWIEL